MISEKLKKKLEQRAAENAFRKLGRRSDLVDFSSNDYLGFAKSDTIYHKTHQELINNYQIQNGATGSRLLTGNYDLYHEIEHQLSNSHCSERTLIFNSGYDANLGFFSSVPQRNDAILFDEYCHASIRDGISMSHAKSYKFKHNDLNDLTKLLLKHSNAHDDLYVVTESVFSMDGDSPELKILSELCKSQNAYLIIDEAHAIGVFGNNGTGLIPQLSLENSIFARIITFGKALGTHGAAILGQEDLINYLINFSRPFIYTTALPPHTLATIKVAIEELNKTHKRHQLQQNIVFFNAEVKRLHLEDLFITSYSAIHSCIISGNENVKSIAQKLQSHGFDIKPILSPTVPKQKERLRFCLHAFNTKKEISQVLELLTTFAI
ncbi:aminotransferase class I/II-fold pyridoxal phosphate-dependent enzyme [uncultured Psychroserpens sp.]|uniref:aminotransferase class I/II-fold pyridoxal phosphate-dependent enzyme n=1 Tax=uncultured Psychroserpens sp. TaxID=255436 RepID=UPI00261535FC|nr:aminotransferase class I/II-fold pyridoxal phosphate-dependent enzyme [uncultured Psychroserpens sp.]